MKPLTVDDWERWTRRLREAPAIIVEGKKDVRSLHKLGLTNIVPLDGPLHATIDRINVKRCAVLTDLDSEGKRLHGLLKTELQRNGVHVDDELRTFLFNTPVRHIEGLAAYLRTAQIIHDDWLR